MKKRELKDLQKRRTLKKNELYALDGEEVKFEELVEEDDMPVEEIEGEESEEVEEDEK